MYWEELEKLSDLYQTDPDLADQVEEACASACGYCGSKRYISEGYMCTNDKCPLVPHDLSMS